MPLKLWAGLGALALLVGMVTLFYANGHKAGVAVQAKRDAPVIAGLTHELAACQLTVRDQSGALNAQNAAIDQLQADAAERARAADAALRKAQAEARKYRDKAERIARLPPSSPDLCKAADDVLTQGLLEARK